MSLSSLLSAKYFFKPIQPSKPLTIPVQGSDTGSEQTQGTKRKRSASPSPSEDSFSQQQSRKEPRKYIEEFTDSGYSSSSESSDSSSSDSSSDEESGDTLPVDSGLFNRLSFLSPSTVPLVKPKPDIYERLFGSNLQEAHFQQRGIGDCYLVAGFDAILRHPAGPAILRKIQIQEIPGIDDNPGLYCVKFPTGKQIIINTAEIGMERRGRQPLEGPDGLKILELAYAKMVRNERNRALDKPHPNNGRGFSPILVEGGSVKTALKDMLGGTGISVRAKDNLPSGFTITAKDPLSKNPNSLKNLTALLKEISEDTDHHYLLGAATPDDLPKGTQDNEIISIPTSISTTPTRKKFFREHCYAVRDFDLKKNTITVVNPHDTKSKIYTLTLKEFCSVFQNIEGIKLDKASL